MYKKILFALDLEGVNNICGEPYSGLSCGSEEWEKARHQGALEINCAARALFKAGVEKISLWDNHGGGVNIVPEELDERIELINVDLSRQRMYFADNGAFDCICFFGYHAMEGTLGGVLAHTMDSKSNQYYKLNGKYIGEVDIDTYIAASHQMASVFFAAGDITCRQALHSLPHLTAVVTKREISRNEAEYKENNLLFEEIEEKITEAIKDEKPIQPCSFPAIFEKSFKRTEDAAKYLVRLRKNNIEADYPSDSILGKDAHTVISTVRNISEFIICI